MDMSRTPNWKELDLKGHCGTCLHYVPFIKKEKLTAHGNCGLRDVYKMRTERCKKYETATGSKGD